jgi:hypothetical protein
MKAVIVTWLDAQFCEIQASSIELGPFEPVTMRTIGFLFADKKNCIVLAMDDLDGAARQFMTIPRCSILKVKEVK